MKTALATLLVILCSASAHAQVTRKAGYVRADAEIVQTGACRSIRLVETTLTLGWMEQYDHTRYPDGLLMIADQTAPLTPGCPPLASMASWRVGGNPPPGDDKVELRAVRGKCVQGDCTALSLKSASFTLASDNADHAVVSGLAAAGPAGDLLFAVDSRDRSAARKAYNDAIAKRRTSDGGQRNMLREAFLRPTATGFDGYMVVNAVTYANGRTATETVLIKGDPQHAQIVAYVLG